MKLLALETSGTEGSVALAVGRDLMERQIPSPREQTALVLPLVAELLAEARIDLTALDAIVFGRGPGSFTGLRVAAAIAQGLALSGGPPLVAVSSLAAVAQRAYATHGISSALVCVDARMGETYFGLFGVEDGVARVVGTEGIARPGQVPLPDGSGWSALGSSFAVHVEDLAEHARLAEHVLADLEPRAQDLLPAARAEVEAGRFVVPEDALPVYLRGADAWKR